jgi:ferredoxin/coenzyme F420-reducing hydrogenase delta subunit
VNAASARAPIAVALCDGLAAPGGESELAALCAALERALPDVCAVVVHDLCRNAERGPTLASSAGATRLVLGTCSDSVSPHDVQRRARRAGLDPFAVELVRLPEACVSKQSSDGVVPRLTAAVARVRAFAGTAPEQLRPRLLVEETAVSRSSLLTLPPITYEPVPSVEHQRCLGPDRCGLCLQVCPFQALGAEEGRIVADKQQCEGCGLCLTACPAGAVSLPGSSLPQYQAQLAVLLGSDEPAVLFCCRKAAVALGGATGGWLPVEVPCIGMVTPGWTLQALARGATTVGLASCGRDCRCYEESVLEGRVGYTRDLLRMLGDETASDRVLAVTVGEAGVQPPPRLPPLGPADASEEAPSLAEPAATATALLRLGGGNRGRRGGLPADRASPLGLVHVRASACTACGACAAVCPTGALRLEEGVEGVVLSYDAAACIGCGRCALNCPETAAQALRAEHATDLRALARGRTSLKVEPLARCGGCGRPIAPSAMLGRIRALLADEEQAGPLFSILGGLCTACRGSTLSAGGPARLEASRHRPAIPATRGKGEQ